MRTTPTKQLAGAPLYRFVHGSNTRFLVVSLLLAGLFVQPIHHAAANEPDDSGETEAATSTTAIIDESESESESEPEQASETAVATSGEESDASTQAESADEATSSSPEAGTSSDQAEPTEKEIDETEEVVANSATTTAPAEIDTDTPSSTASDEAPNDEVATTSAASSTDDIVAGTSTSTSTPTTTDATTTATSGTETTRDASASATTSTSTPDSASSSGSGDTDSSDATVENDTSAASTTKEDETNPVVAGTATSTETSTYSDSAASSSDSTQAASTTQQMDEEVSAAITSITNDENRHQFGEKQCVSVGDGSFYCQTEATAENNSSGPVVEARLDGGDYYDIYVRTTGGTKNITNSSYNDRAPHYDATSRSVVWHREIDGRYQIMTADLSGDDVQQITDTATHNMEPTRSGDVTVWQRWIDGQWQVMAQIEKHEAQQLSDGSAHSLAPYVRYPYVIWQTTSVTGERELAVYDVESEHISYITDSDGGEVRNPRFVLVYDTTLANGDVVTQGYDPETGDVKPLSAIPRDPLPDIPSPDPIDETRALVQQKPGSTTEEAVQPVAGDDPDTSDSSASVGTSSATSTYTLDMSTTTATTTLSEYDLVVPPATTTNQATSSRAQ